MIKTIGFFIAVTSPIWLGALMISFNISSVVGSILIGAGLASCVFLAFVTFYEAKDKELRKKYSNLTYKEQIKYWLLPAFRKEVKNK